jgi:tetrapyrrole methylase family protein/MazG family protein
MHLKFKHLLEIAEKLRQPGGCPWDREQTIKSMKPLLLEEAEEVAEAIDSGDLKHVEEELGDLLFCILMIAQIASEKKDFDMGSILEANAEKIVSRHTWVFGTDKAETAEEALALWMKNKEKEKARKVKKS